MVLLFEWGVDLNVGDDVGMFFLWFVVDGFSIEFVKLFLRVNCNFDI